MSLIDLKNVIAQCWVAINCEGLVTLFLFTGAPWLLLNNGDVIVRDSPPPYRNLVKEFIAFQGLNFFFN